MKLRCPYCRRLVTGSRLGKKHPVVTLADGSERRQCQVGDSKGGRLGRPRLLFVENLHIEQKR